MHRGWGTGGLAWVHPGLSREMEPWWNRIRQQKPYTIHSFTPLARRHAHSTPWPHCTAPASRHRYSGTSSVKRRRVPEYNHVDVKVISLVIRRHVADKPHVLGTHPLAKSACKLDLVGHAGGAYPHLEGNEYIVLKPKCPFTTATVPGRHREGPLAGHAVEALATSRMFLLPRLR